MNHGKKYLLAATALTIIALSSVVAVYAVVILGTITGGTVTVGGVATGTISYNADNGASGWTPDLQPSSSWYAKLVVNAGYAGPVTITWKLQSDASGTWADVALATVATNIVLTGAGQTVYASTDGTQAANQNWTTYAGAAGAYRVIAVVNSAS
jgi:hypothetical protein